MKKIVYRIFSSQGFFLAILMVASVVWSQSLWANVVITSSSQSPQNNVTLGEKITYTLNVRNTKTFQIFPQIEIRSGKSSVTATFTSESGGCIFDTFGDKDLFFCGALKLNASYSFSITPEVVGTIPLEFIVDCTAGQSQCSGETASFETVVQEPVSGNIQFEKSDYTVNENGGSVVLKLNRVNGNTGTLTASVSTASGSAKNGQDFKGRTVNLEFKGTVTSHEVVIDIVEDSEEEGDESFTVKLTDSNGGDGSTNVTIKDTTERGTLQFSLENYDVKESDEEIVVTVNRVGGSDGPLSAFMEISNGTANAGDDYTVPAENERSLNWGDGDRSSKSVTIPIKRDDSVEPTETVSLTLSGDSPTVSATIRIADSTKPGTPVFASSNFNVSEEGGTAVITINREGGSDGPLSAQVEVSDGSAKAGADYTKPGDQDLNVSWGTGDSGSREVRIPITKDDVVEPDDETINLKLFSGESEIGTATVLISDSTNPGTFRFTSNGFTAAEGNEAEVKVTREGGSDGALSVTIGLTDDTATQGEDYQPPESTRLDWASGESGEKILRIAINKDAVVDDNETVNLQLFVGSNQSASGSAVLTLKDTTQPGTVSFSRSTFSGEEGSSAEISVTREQGSDGELSVNLVIGAEGDAAIAGEDYQRPDNTQLSWGAGESGVRTISIPLLADELEEGAEQLSLQLQAGETILGNASLTINDAAVLGGSGAAVDKFEILAGNRQRGGPGAVLSPFIVKVLDVNAQAIEGVNVDWSVSPADGGSLSEGANTETDAQGESGNTFTVNTNDRVVITATISQGSISAQKAVSNRQPRAEGDPTVTFIVNGGIADTEGLNKNQRSVATALDSACPALEGKADRNAGEDDLLATCRELQTGDPDAVAEGLKLLAPDEITAQGTAVIEAANLQVMNINARLNALRSGAKGIDVSGLNFNIDGQLLPGSLINSLLKGEASGGAAGDMAVRWGGFINATLSFGEKDDSDNETGFDFDSQGITIGADYRLSNQMVIGGAIGITSNTSDFNNSAGSMELDSMHLMAYGTYYQTERFYVDGLIRLGGNDYDTRRRVSRANDPLQEAAGSTDGQEYSLSLSGGYEYDQGPMSYGPYGRLSYTKAEIDAYTETASDPGAKGAGSVLSLSDQDVDSLTAVIGGQVSYAISRPSGVFLPQARFEWEHEFSDDSRALEARFVHDPTSSTFAIATDEPDRDYFNLGLGFSMVAAEGRSGFLFYETRLDQADITQHWIKAGFRLEFR